MNIAGAQTIFSLPDGRSDAGTVRGDPVARVPPHELIRKKMLYQTKDEFGSYEPTITQDGNPSTCAL